MKFINPKTDYAFKKIFGSDQSQDILISFLNAIVYQGETFITSLEIIDPYAPGRISGLKTTYFDVKAQLNNGENVLIEMQAFNVPAFGKRILYNTAKMYVNQLKLGEVYPELRAAIGVAVTDFIMFNEHNKVISQFTLKEDELQVNYQHSPLKLVFVELPKFNKTLEELTTITDKWLYFLRKAPDLEVVPESMLIVPEIEKAFAIADRVNLSLEEVDDLEKREQFERERIGAIELGKAQGRTEGLTQGRAEGRAEGIEIGEQIGEQRGEQRGKINLIKRQLKRQLGELNQSIEDSLSQLTSEQLSALAEAIFDFSSVGDLSSWLETNCPS
ncbi:Rpn family recombination-promoting nuclease/putative transposase [Planktothrix agardhii]|uniref:Rpn family recombination-promoting nuclease/putative transposase n=1 Tax=Planktothrix agardhii TaxID=1160 RepID=UPI002876B416|nr:Rpn family recombination-promoting nuclease/putative transposase [Planktothrix agardhii]MDS1347240.1 Rpn family recombination-promoting nuclease/putative transposase [Planktothrix agardhii NRERC-751]